MEVEGQVVPGPGRDVGEGAPAGAAATDAGVCERVGGISVGG